MTEKLKIINILFTAERGGLEQAFINYTKSMLAYGHKVVCVMRGSAPYRGEIEASGAEIKYISPVGFYDLLAMVRLAAFIRKEKPNLVLAHNGRAAHFAKIAAIGSKVPVVGVSHGYKTKHFRSTNGVIVLGQHMFEHFVANGFKPHRVKIVPNMLDLHELHTNRGHDYLHDATIKHQPVIAAAGRLSPDKGFDVLIDALSIIKKKGIKFHAGIAGVGPLESKLKSQIGHLGLQHDVSLVGWVSDIRNWLMQADVMCVPSREESFGMVILEAFAAGLPVVASDAPGPSEILVAGGGMVVPKDNPHELAESIIKLISDHNLWQKMRQDGWDNLKNYDHRKVSGHLQAAIAFFSRHS